MHAGDQQIDAGWKNELSAPEPKSHLSLEPLLHSYFHLLGFLAPSIFSKCFYKLKD